MLFNSFPFLIFFPLVTLVYFLIPERLRVVWLLGASYYFYMCWNPKYALLMLLSTTITYFSGLLLRDAERIPDPVARQRRKKLWVGLSFGSNLAILCTFKYLSFLLDNLVRLLGLAGLSVTAPAIDLLLPVGISFYTFQALGYTVDVYRGDTRAEPNFFRYALFVSFFPQLVAGPIERSGSLLKQLQRPRKFHYRRARAGLLRMGWGFFQKLVIADRVALWVDTVFNDPAGQPGSTVAVATVLFTFQIYCDFGGYSNIAIGAAQVMGIRLMDNFHRPFLALSIQDFWRRWHISLSTWFRVVGKLTRPPRKALRSALHIQEEGILRKLVAVPLTFCLTSFAFLFFRANSLGDAVTLIRAMVLDWQGSALAGEGLYQFGLDRGDFTVAVIALAVLILADLLNEWRDMGKWLEKQVLPLRWVAYLLLLFTILVFGIYRPNYDAAAFN